MPRTSFSIYRKANLLHRVLLSLVVIFTCYNAAIWSLMPGVTPAKVVALLTMMVLIIVASLSRRERYFELCAQVLVGVIIVAGLLASITNGGLQGYVTPVLLTAPIAAAIFLGARAAQISAALVVVALGVQVALGQFGVISDTPYGPDATRTASLIMLITTTAICTAAVSLFASDAEAMIGRLLKTKEELQDAQALSEERRQIAEERRLEAEAAAKAESAFLSNMSHEMRTPLNGVLGMIQIFESSELTARQQEQVAIMRTCGDSLLALINDVLDLAKLDAGQYQLRRDPIDLAALITTVEHSVHASIIEKGLYIRSSIDDDLEVFGDEKVLRQILVNFVGNAVKFTEKGGVRIAVTCEPNGEVMFAVSDTGPGVAEEKQSLIFQRFAQADRSVTREFGGAGLGLAISERFVAMMQGDIGMQNNEAGGATFWFRAPLAGAEASAEAERQNVA